MANDTAKTLTIGGVTHPIEDAEARQAITSVQAAIASLQNVLDAILNGDATSAIETFQEVIDFLDGVSDNETFIGKLNALNTSISGKVDIVPGKGLSANDYTTEDKNKLAGIAAGAEVNVVPDSEMSDSSTNAVQNRAIKAYVDNRVNDLINGAPGTLDTLKELADALGDNDDAIVALTTAIAAKVNTADLAVVAKSGSYNDLGDKPTIPTALSDLSEDSMHRSVTDTEKATWGGKQNALTFDSMPTANSTNPVTSGGVKTYVDGRTSMPVVSLTPTNNVAALEANKYYLLGSVGSSTVSSNVLTLSFTTSQVEALSYMGRFTAVADALSLSLPSGIHFTDSVPSIEAGHTYEFNILYDTCLLTDITRDSR